MAEVAEDCIPYPEIIEIYLAAEFQFVAKVLRIGRQPEDYIAFLEDVDILLDGLVVNSDGLSQLVV